MTRAGWAMVVLAGAVVSGGMGAGSWIFDFKGRDNPERFSDPIEEFKYGSVGTEARFGIPWHLWRIMPSLCANLVPKRPLHGDGWANFGLVYEKPDSKRPIGLSYRDKPIGLVGLNCAACHAGSVRDVQGGPAKVVLGMPAQQFDLDGYLRFMARCGADPRFNENKLIRVMRDDKSFTRLDEYVYRHYAIPRTRAALVKLQQAFEKLPTTTGAGRVDLIAAEHALLGLPPPVHVARADFMSLFGDATQKDGGAGRGFGWDGDNASRAEVGYAHALATGADPASLDTPSIDRALAFTATLAPMPWPRPLDSARVERGAALFEKSCANCHRTKGNEAPPAGVTTLQSIVGTDARLLDGETQPLLDHLNSLGGKNPDWKITGYKKSVGYANVPLNGLWLRAPYLHNGSVPSLQALLLPPQYRPKRFFRGSDAYDYDRVGWNAIGCAKDSPNYECMAVEVSGNVFLTTEPGDSNDGHAYGSELSLGERDDLLEYLKTL